jgi:ADP-ribose pyrophosphatase
MCDPGEKISQTLKREFMEEATDCLGANQEARSSIEDHLNHLFENGVEVVFKFCSFLLDI